MMEYKGKMDVEKMVVVGIRWRGPVSHERHCLLRVAW